MAVHEACWRRGIDQALLYVIIDLAQNWLGLTRLELEVYTDNVTAIRLYEKVGFVLEGTQRQCALRDGVLIDAHVMARLRLPR